MMLKKKILAIYALFNGKKTSLAINPDHGSPMPNMQWKNSIKNVPKNGGSGGDHGKMTHVPSFFTWSIQESNLSATLDKVLSNFF